jgi:hypothetical protein
MRRVVLMLAASALAGLARAGDAPPPEGADDPARADYLATLNALAAKRLPDLEAASSDALDRAPCVRAELAVWLSIKGDGAIAEAHADEGSGHPGEVRDAVAAKVAAWKLPPPPGGKPTRVRLSLGVMPSAPIPARLNCDAELLDVGSYHVTQLVPGIERGKWRAVCKTGDAADVRTLKVSLKRYRDPEDDADEKTGRRVLVKGCDAPAFLFRNLSTVAGGDGPVPSAKVTVSPAKADDWGRTADVSFGPTTYHLRIQAAAGSKGGEEPRPWKIMLDEDGATQEIDVGGSVRPPSLAIRWAGDLDGDGRPDFALENRDDGVDLRLYLSGSARRGRRVRQVAATSWGGG